MKPYLVRFWHGFSDNDKLRAWILALPGIRQTGDSNIFWDGTLETWFKVYPNDFLVRRPSEEEREFISGTIWVTQHKGFGQR
jgi:hypothetical protein